MAAMGGTEGALNLLRLGCMVVLGAQANETARNSSQRRNAPKPWALIG